MTKRYSSLSPLGNLSALRPGVSFVTNPRILTIAGFSAVAGVSADFYLIIISGLHISIKIKYSFIKRRDYVYII